MHTAISPYTVRRNLSDERNRCLVPPPPQPLEWHERPSTLTAVECEVATLIARGKRMKEIASIRNVGVRTIESQRENIARKIAAETGWQPVRRPHIVKYAVARGWVTHEQTHEDLRRP